MENLGLIIVFIIFSVVRRLLQKKGEPPVPGKPGRRLPPERGQEGRPVKVREAEKGRSPFDELEQLFERFSGSGQRTEEESYTVSQDGSVIRSKTREEPVVEKNKIIKLEKKKEEMPREERDRKKKIMALEKSASPVNLEIVPEDVSPSGFRVTADNAAAGILFSEILGPPRSRKPFSLRQSNKIQNSIR